MAFSSDHEAISSTLGGWRSGHNPDARERSGELDMAPDIWRRMMAGTITPHEAQAEWKAREPAQRAFNDRLRSQAGFGMVTDTEQALDPDTGQPAMRDASTGQYADLNEAARAAKGVDVPGGIVPTENPVQPNGNDEIRDAYWRMKGQQAA